LDLDSIADLDPVVNEYILADVATLTDHRCCHDMRKMPDLGTGTNNCPIIYNRTGMDKKGICHDSAFHDIESKSKQILAFFTTLPQIKTYQCHRSKLPPTYHNGGFTACKTTS
jgi:hypothetical protein